MFAYILLVYSIDLMETKWPNAKYIQGEAERDYSQLFFHHDLFCVSFLFIFKDKEYFINYLLNLVDRCNLELSILNFTRFV
jgi:hypothetical protein